MEAAMPILPDVEIRSNAWMEELVEVLRRAMGSVRGFGRREVAAIQLTNEAVRRQLERDLQELEDGFDEELLVDGTPYRRHLEGEGRYHSLCGPLQVPRYTYREVGVRNGPTVVPLELAAGIVELATPALGYSIALGYGESDMRRHEETLRAAGRVPPSRTTMETIAGRIGSAAQQRAPAIERSLRRSERVPAEARGAAIGLDRTAVPMEEPRPEGQPPNSTRKTRTKPRVRQAPAPVDVNWRMAYVGTFTLVDSDGDAVVVRRYTGTPGEDPRQLVKHIMADLRHALRQDPALRVGVIQDAAPELWNLVREALAIEPLVSRWDEGIDIYHLYEHLARALTLVERKKAHRKATMANWKEMLRERDCAIDVIEIELLHAYYSLRPGPTAAKLWEELVYIRNNKDRMRYATLQRRGLPVGSGVTEGACKSVIARRAKGSGQRWHEDGLGAALTLRAIHRSDRLPRFWKSLSRRYTAPIEAVA
jgi:hypothetical protein